MVPQGVLQGLPNSLFNNRTLTIIIGGLYDYPAAPDWDRYVDQSQNPKV